MSHKTRARIRALFTVPSAAVLVLGASELLASPAAAASRIPDCETYCMTQASYCNANPTAYYCIWCGCASIEP